MVDQKEEKIERVYVVNLSKAYNTVRQKRGKRAIKILKEFVARHLKEDIEKIKVSNNLNKKIFERSIKHPPKKIKIRAIKDKTKTNVYLFDEKIEKKEKKKKEEEKKALTQPKKEEVNKVEKQEQKIEEDKKDQKESKA